MSDEYRKHSIIITVHTYDGGDLTPFEELFAKHEIPYKSLNTEIKYQDKRYYRRSISFMQDGNTFVLSQGKYLVEDEHNTFSVVTEERLKKLFDKVYHHGI